jgi:hypothetical protein
MKRIIVLLVLLILISCKQDTTRTKPEDPEKVRKEDRQRDSLSSKGKLKKYSSQKWHFSILFPDSLQILESELPGNSPVVNIYDPAAGETPPFAIHEEASLAYIAVLPEGFGVDAPSGNRKSFKEWGSSLPLSFNISPERSTVYLLENGEPWAFDLRFYQSPEGWGEYGSIFVHYAVKDFSSECFDEKGKSKDPKDCDPMGKDRVEFSGNVQQRSKDALNAVLESLEFLAEGAQKRQIYELLRLEEPLPNMNVSSPLIVEGEARGYWFFEGDAPVKLVDKNEKILGRGYISAKGEWMTEDFVPFKGRIEFTAPDDERGYLVLERSNASGKPEHDRIYRLPVLFPPKS